MNPQPLTELRIETAGEGKTTGWALRERLCAALEKSGRVALARQAFAQTLVTSRYAEVAPQVARYARLAPESQAAPLGARQALSALADLLAQGETPLNLNIDGVCAWWNVFNAEGVYRRRRFPLVLFRSDREPWLGEAADTHVKALATYLGLATLTLGVEAPASEPETYVYQCVPRTSAWPSAPQQQTFSAQTR